MFSIAFNHQLLKYRIRRLTFDNLQRIFIVQIRQLVQVQGMVICLFILKRDFMNSLMAYILLKVHMYTKQSIQITKSIQKQSYEKAYAKALWKEQIPNSAQIFKLYFFLTFFYQYCQVFKIDEVFYIFSLAHQSVKIYYTSIILGNLEYIKAVASMLNPYQTAFEDSFSDCSSDQFIMVSRRSRDPASKTKKQKVRVLQKSLILVSHLPQWFSNPKIIEKQILFGRYGKIKSIIISSNHSSYKKKKTNEANQVQAYITYENDFDASIAIKALNGYKIGTRIISATYGTNRYCSSIETNIKCRLSSCYFIHQKRQSDQFVTPNLLGNERQQQTANQIINSNLEYFAKKIKEDNFTREVKIYPSRLQSHTKFIIFPSIKEVIDEMIMKGALLKYKFQEARQKVQIEQKTTKKSLNETTKRIEYYRIRSKTQKNVQIPQNHVDNVGKIQHNLAIQKCSSAQLKGSSSDLEQTSKQQLQTNSKIQQASLQSLVLKQILEEKEPQQQKQANLDKKYISKKKRYIIKSQRQVTSSKQYFQEQCSYLKLFGKPFQIGSDEIIQQYQSIQKSTTGGSSNSTSLEKDQTCCKNEEFPTISNQNKMKKQNSQKVLKSNLFRQKQSQQDSYLVTKVTREIMKKTILKRSKVLNNDSCKFNQEMNKQWKHITKLMIGSLLGSKKSIIYC